MDGDGGGRWRGRYVARIDENFGKKRCIAKPTVENVSIPFNRPTSSRWAHYNNPEQKNGALFVHSSLPGFPSSLINIVATSSILFVSLR